MEHDLARLTRRALVAQLRQVENTIGSTPTFLPVADGPGTLNCELLDLLAREVRLLDELRSRFVSSSPRRRAPTPRGIT